LSIITGQIATAEHFGFAAMSVVIINGAGVIGDEEPMILMENAATDKDGKTASMDITVKTCRRVRIRRGKRFLPKSVDVQLFMDA
jgi:hypothetical protein